jgi:hypothetical protein
MSEQPHPALRMPEAQRLARIRLRCKIEDAIGAWRDDGHTAEHGILHLHDPSEVKELARAIRNALLD